MLTKKKKKKKSRNSLLILLILIFIPIAFFTNRLAFNAWEQLKKIPIFEQILQEKSEIEIIMENFDMPIPLDYIPIYQAAAEKYGIDWPLLAAHHRIETRFSTMKTDVSPAGAEGPMQFMPCTFVGWSHPTCSGLGEGKIPVEEKVNPKVIAKYGGYGVDGDGDGKADPFNLYDAIFSAAHYLSKNGAQTNDLTAAVFNYNHSHAYVADVLYFYELYSSYEKEITKSIQVAKSE